MTPARWQLLNDYSGDLFGPGDDQLATLPRRASAVGLPDIAVSPDVGALLGILAAGTEGKLALEVGTLGGYSGIWIARSLASDGKLLTIESEESHADFAETEFARAGLAERVEVVRGQALTVIPSIGHRVGPESLDFVFIDAAKDEYVAYFELIRPLVKVGGLVVADNVLGTGQGWLDEGYGTDDFNRLVAADSDYFATITPMRQGLLIARRMR